MLTNYTNAPHRVGRGDYREAAAGAQVWPLVSSGPISTPCVISASSRASAVSVFRGKIYHENAEHAESEREEDQ